MAIDVIEVVLEGPPGPPGDPGPPGPPAAPRLVLSANSVSGLYNYIGIAPVGSLQTDLAWTIKRISLTAPVGTVTSITSAAWTNRESAVYA